MLSASFNVLNDPNDTAVICNVSSFLVIVGDLKFYFQILGRENMSGSWCCWCTTHPSTWDKLCTSHNRDKQEDTWTISKLKDYKHRIEAGQLKEAREKKGVVHHPVWDFIEPDHFMFPQLHVEIGLVNNVLENYYDFVEDQVEAATPEQKVARNNVIIATRSLERAKERLAEWKNHGPRDLATLRARKLQLNAHIRRHETVDLLLEKLDLERRIDQLIADRRQMEKAVQAGKKEVTNKKAALKEAGAKKQKIEKPVHTEIELLLNKFNISAAAYHGGKLNGVDCRRLMHNAFTIFSEIENILLSIQNPERCTDIAIRQESELHRDILSVLDTICSRLRKKTGEPTLEDYEIVEASVANLNYLWTQAHLNFTPKLHSTLEHSLDHMRRFNGIGDMLEDDVEHIHQIAAKIEARVSRMKNKSGQALVHSKMEAMQNSREIREAMDNSMQLSKRTFKNDLQTNLKLSEAKEQRERRRMATLKRIAQIREAAILRSS
jgi:hypothetical protein